MGSDLVAQAPNSLGEQLQLADRLVKSKLLPDSIKTPEQALAIMLKGKELGIPPMQAFSQINVIQGKPTISPELMLALIYKKYPDADIQFTKLERTGCEIMASRPGKPPTKIAFTEEDAKSAGLLGKHNWKAYPRPMYRSRAIAEMARTLFPDAISGLSYTPEEMGAQVNEDFEIIDATPRPCPEVYEGKDLQKRVLAFFIEKHSVIEKVDKQELHRLCLEQQVPMQNLEKAVIQFKEEYLGGNVQ